MKLLLYCTKAKPYLTMTTDFVSFRRFDCYDRDLGCLNGKIVAECDYEVEEIFEDNFEDARDGYVEHFYTLKSYDDFDEGQKVLLKESCLQKHELSNYLGFENGYAIHIKNLHIFDEPKELSEYYTKKKNNVEENEDLFMDGILYTTIKSAPQNMMYAKQPLKEDKIIISIKPEWLCKILNGEKTIEVRKKVLTGWL